MSTSSVRRHLQVGIPSATLAVPGATFREPRAFAIWLALVGYVAASKLVLDTFLPDAFALPGQAFSWQAIIISAAAGLAGVGSLRRPAFRPPGPRG